MRIVNFDYHKEAYVLMKLGGIYLSNRRLRRLTYLDVHQVNYTLYKLYNDYKKTVNSDAANNQLMVLFIVIALMTATLLLVFT